MGDFKQNYYNAEFQQKSTQIVFKAIISIMILTTFLEFRLILFYLIAVKLV